MGRRDHISHCLAFGGMDFDEDSALFLRPLQQIFYKATVSLGAAFRGSKFLERKDTTIDFLQKSSFDTQNQYFQPLFWHLCKRSIVFVYLSKL